MGVKESYGAIGFTGTTKAGRFDGQIREGRKTQTIREPRKDGRPHVKVGHLTKLYWKMRAKECFLIATVEVTAYEKLDLLDVWWDEENAKADGFKDLEEFRDWFCPNWFKLQSVSKEAIEIAATLDRDITSGIIELGKLGKSTTAQVFEKLIQPYYRIKWKLSD